MKEIIKRNKPVIRFLSVFFVSYFVLTILYRLFLHFSGSLDGFTQLVSNQSVRLMHFFGLPITTVTKADTISLMNDNRLIAYIAEGCNAVSVIILFVAFILAFSKHWKPTLLYILFGIVFIHIMNVLRIAFFIMLLQKFPEQQDFLHDIFFPAIIYGAVFLLWVNWVRMFQKENHNG